jgi:hypothetical protein
VAQHPSFNPRCAEHSDELPLGHRIRTVSCGHKQPVHAGRPGRSQIAAIGGIHVLERDVPLQRAVEERGPSAKATAVSSAAKPAQTTRTPRKATTSSCAKSRLRNRTPARGRGLTLDGTVRSTTFAARASIPCQCAAAGPATTEASPAQSHAERTRASSVSRCPPTRNTPGCSRLHRPSRTRRWTRSAEYPCAAA